MLRLVYSNRTEELLAALAETLRERRAAGAHPLEPVELVVPNRNMEQYVRLGLAERLGVAGNLSFRRLERFVADLAAAAVPGGRLVEAEALAGGVLAVLHDEQALAAPELAPVRTYLAAPDADGVALRRVQLAERLGRLFEEYAYSRPEMLAAWRAGTASAFAEGAPELAAWQRALWRRVAGPDGLLAAHPPAGGRWVSLAEIVTGELPLPAAARPLHVFGVSYVARAFSALFRRLAQARPLWLFALNPSQEFWEDVETPAELRHRLRRTRAGARLDERLLDPAEDPYGLFQDTGNLPLRLWGRPGREHVMLLNEISECDFEPRFRDPGEPAPTLLAALQRDVLLRVDTPEAPPRLLPADGSLQVIAAPDLRREVETVADAIWALVRGEAAALPGHAPTPPLSFADVAVIVNAPARDRYLPQIQAAFAEQHGIPCNVSDLPLAASRATAEAARLLLDLPFGRRTRADLLRLMTHPAVAAGDPAERAGWGDLAADLGIFFGDSRRDLDGTYVDGDLLSWDQGLRRLALGAFMTGPRSGEDRLWEGDGGEVLVADVGPGRLAGAGRFALLARSLLADAARLRDERRPLAEWAAVLRGLLAAYLAPPPGEEVDLQRCLAALSALERQDVAGEPVSGRVACELARGAIDALGGGRGAYLAEGVSVSTLLPMRAIPFRVVFLVGLAEGEFPARNRRDALDLRAGRRLPGDVTPAERDRYLFLEALLSARERLVVTYVARDDRTGEALRPSGVVQELLETLARGYVGAEQVPALHREVPVRRWQPAAEQACAGATPPAVAADLAAAGGAGPPYPSTVPAAAGEVAARRLGDELAGALRATEGDPLRRLRRELPPASWADLAAFFALVAPPPAPAAAAAATAPRALQVRALRDFLECPLQGSAATVLGLRRDDQEDVARVEEEVFRTPPRDETTLLRDALATATRRGGAATDAYGELARRRELAGAAPTGLLGEIERELHAELLAGWQELLADLLAAGRGERLRFGRVPEREEVDHVLPALALPPCAGAPAGVELHGRSELLLAGRRASVVADPAAPKEAREELNRELRLALRGLCDHLLLAASGELANVGRQLVVLRRGESAPRRVSWQLRPIRAAAARALLADLTCDLLGRVHDYLLPCEAVFEVWRETRHLDAARVAATARELVAGRRRCASRYGPVPDPAGYAPLPPAELAAVLARRWQPLLDLLGERGEGR